MNPFDLIELKSFWNLWYWALVVVTWSMTAHWTLGVPFDVIVRANRKGGIFAEHCEAIAQINIYRLTYLFDRAGVALSASAAFLLAVIGTLGFFQGLEVFMALFLILAPLSLVMALSVRFAFRAQTQGWSGEALRKKLLLRRFWNQVIGMLSVMLTTAAGVVTQLQSMGYL